MDRIIRWIPLSKIQPIYKTQIPAASLKQMKRLTKYYLIYDLVLAVEQDSTKQGNFHLVGGYDRYQYLIDNFNKNTRVPCIIEGTTNQEGKYLKVMRRLHQKGDSNNANKTFIVHCLQSIGTMLDSIVSKTGFTKTELTRLSYDDNIPSNYIKIGRTEKSFMNRIEKLSLDQDVKQSLFELVGIKESHINEEKITRVEEFLKSKASRKLEELNSTNQIKILKCAMNFKGMTFPILQKMIEDYKDKY